MNCPFGTLVCPVYIVQFHVAAGSAQVEIAGGGRHPALLCTLGEVVETVGSLAELPSTHKALGLGNAGMAS
jgi:hypothetical protein